MCRRGGPPAHEYHQKSMTRYIIRRLLQAIPLLLIISIVLFAMMQAMGDPLATMGGRKVTRPEDRIRLAKQLGLDKPGCVQYVYWLIGNDWTRPVGEIPEPNAGILNPIVKCLNPLNYIDSYATGTRKGVLRGDWGISLVNRQPVTKVIGERLTNTLLLMVTAEAIIISVALLIGIYSALHQYSAADNIITATTFVLYSMPVFFFALLAMYIFSVNFRKWGLPYLPTVGMFEPSAGPSTMQLAWHMILPVATLSFGFIAGYSRYIRSAMLETLGQDYVRTAKAKGLPRREVVYIHALKNAALPIVTLVALDLPFLLGGAIVTERIFGWPGMGRLFLDHVERSDTAVVMGIMMMIAFAVIIFQIIADVTYAWLDPRIRYK
ncbi:MAG: diguanylate cyclase [Anaerolineales bacterium]|nr:ABC transporter permease [Anaerolineae bacterium]PWB50930.1 MAG: diguanylate cyclase [Anaerolineales bacterium]